MTISLLLGILVGAVLGLTGAGGGILAVPALVVGLGWSMQQAAPVALIAVAAGAVVGAAEGLRHKLVRYKAAMLMAAVGIPVTSVGLLAANALPSRLLLVAFAVMMLWVAQRMFRQARNNEDDDHQIGAKIGQMNSDTGRLNWNLTTAAMLAGIGAATGFMTGLLGVGGGFVIVPLLRRFTDVKMHGVVATSLLTIALVGIGGVISAVWQGAELPMPLTLLFAAALSVGMLLGRLASRRLSSRRVQTGFSVVVALVAIGLLVKAGING